MISPLLDQHLTIERQQISRDGSGGITRDFESLLADVPCAISPASAAVAADYARRDMVVNYHLYTATDLDALLSGGVRLGDRLTDGVFYYLVKSVLKSSNTAVSADPLYQIDCERRIV